MAAWRQLSPRIDPNRRTLNLCTRLAYYLSAIGYSFLSQLQDASRSDALKTVKLSPPLFVLGFWRSGTTLLHELLSCDPRFGFPSTYACLNPSHFLITEAWAAQQKNVIAARPMDNMSYSWGSPQEDEFALLALGAPSPYEALIVPSLMRDPERLLGLRQRTPEQQKRWQDTLQHFLLLLTIQQNKTIVLKSPPHGFKLSLLASMFPEARYVIIERNPYEVFVSNLKLWNSLLNLYALESISPAEIEEFVLAAYGMHEEAISEGVSTIAADRYTRVRYETLVTDPVEEMRRIYRDLKLQNFEDARILIEKHTVEISHHERNRFVLSPQQKSRVEERWGTFIQLKNYSWPERYLKVSV